MRPATGSSGSASAMRTGRPEPNGRRAVPGPLDAHRGRALIPGGETSAPWRAVLERLRHPDVWGPGGLYPLEAFRRTGRGWVARCPGGAHPDRHPSFSMPDGRSFGRCFACGYRRTWIGFVLERQGHSPDARGPAFRSALAVLAERAGMPLDEPARSQDAKLAPPPLAVLAGILKRSLLSDHPRAAACRAYLGSRRVPDAVIPRLPIGAWTEAGAIGAALRAARLPAGLLREHGLLARYVPSHPLLFFYEDTDGVTGFKCRKPVLGEKSVLNALGLRRGGRGPQPLRGERRRRGHRALWPGHRRRGRVRRPWLVRRQPRSRSIDRARGARGQREADGREVPDAQDSRRPSRLPRARRGRRRRGVHGRGLPVRVGGRARRGGPAHAAGLQGPRRGPRAPRSDARGATALRPGPGGAGRGVAGPVSAPPVSARDGRAGRRPPGGVGRDCSDHGNVRPAPIHCMPRGGTGCADSTSRGGADRPCGGDASPGATVVLAMAPTTRPGSPGRPPR